MRKRLLPESELTLEHVSEILKSNKTIDLHMISKHSKSRSQTSAQATEIIKKCKLCENSPQRGKCSTYGKVCHNCNRKNHFKKCCPRNRKTIHDIEQTETEYLLLTNMNFFLVRQIFRKTLKFWLTFLKSKMNPAIGIILYLLMVLQYPIK